MGVSLGEGVGSSGVQSLLGAGVGFSGVEGAVASSGDPYFANVVYLQNFANASDTDVTGKAATRTGNASYSGGELVLDGTGDSLKLNATPGDFAFGTGDYTIEFFCTKSANGPIGYDTVIDWTEDANGSGGYLIELSSTRGFLAWGDGAGSALSAALDPNDSVQHYWAVKRESGVQTIWKDGVQLNLQANVTDVACARAPRIGGSCTSNGLGFNGSFAAFRITTVARDVSVVPTLPFPEA